VIPHDNPLAFALQLVPTNRGLSQYIKQLSVPFGPSAHNRTIIERRVYAPTLESAPPTVKYASSSVPGMPASFIGVVSFDLVLRFCKTQNPASNNYSVTSPRRNTFHTHFDATTAQCHAHALYTQDRRRRRSRVATRCHAHDPCRSGHRGCPFQAALLPRPR
jgi:hypothetical protein